MRLLSLLFQSRRFYRFLYDFWTTGEGKNKQNHWRVVQNQGVDRFRRKRSGARFFIDFGLHFGCFGELFGHLERLFRRKWAIEKAIKNSSSKADLQGVTLNRARGLGAAGGAATRTTFNRHRSLVDSFRPF